MSLNKLFDTIDETRNTANWRAAFGEPHTVEGVTVIPVAQVGYGFGLGFGSGTPPTDEVKAEPSDSASANVAAPAEGGGGGGGSSSKPLGFLVVAPDRVYFQEATQSSKIAMAGILFAAFLIWQLGMTLRAILSRA
jgi:uncharacterized spore protein YtfJ